jgi:hypothetical protein
MSIESETPVDATQSVTIRPITNESPPKITVNDVAVVEEASSSANLASNIVTEEQQVTPNSLPLVSEITPSVASAIPEETNSTMIIEQETDSALKIEQQTNSATSAVNEPKIPDTFEKETVPSMLVEPETPVTLCHPADDTHIRDASGDEEQQGTNQRMKRRSTRIIKEDDSDDEWIPKKKKLTIRICLNPNTTQ